MTPHGPERVATNTYRMVVKITGSATAMVCKYDVLTWEYRGCIHLDERKNRYTCTVCHQDLICHVAPDSEQLETAMQFHADTACIEDFKCHS